MYYHEDNLNICTNYIVKYRLVIHKIYRKKDTVGLVSGFFYATFLPCAGSHGINNKVARICTVTIKFSVSPSILTISNKSYDEAHKHCMCLYFFSCKLHRDQSEWRRLKNGNDDVRNKSEWSSDKVYSFYVSLFIFRHQILCIFWESFGKIGSIGNEIEGRWREASFREAKATHIYLLIVAYPMLP